MAVIGMSLLAVGCGSSNGTSGSYPTVETTTISPTTLIAIQVTPDGAQLAAGTTQQYTATGFYANGSKTALAGNVTWSSANTTVATINSSTGLATAVASGQDTITATLGSVSGSVSLSVAPKTLTNVSLTPSTGSIAAGTTEQLRLVGTFNDGSTQDLTSAATWTSSNTSIASVSSLGLATGASAGTSTITASFGGFSATSSLTVTSASLVSIAVTNAGSASIANGTTTQLEATGTFSDGTTQDLTSTVTWSSNNSADVSVNATTGLVTGLAPGTATITATSGGVSASTFVTVKAVTIVSLTVAPGTTTVPLGTTGQLEAVGVFSDNSSQDLTSLVTWVSGANATVQVSNASGTAGQLTPETPGSTTVTATYGSVSGSSNVTVSNASLASLSIYAITVNTTTGTATNTVVGPTSNSEVTVNSPLTFGLNGTYTDGSVVNLTSSATWSATPNITLPGGNAGSPITTESSGVGNFSTNVTGNFTVTATFSNATSALNGSSVSTNITIAQSPPTGPLLFTGFQSGKFLIDTIDPDTGVLTNVSTTFTSTTSTNPVWSFVTNPEQSLIYLSQFITGSSTAPGAIQVSSLSVTGDATTTNESDSNTGVYNDTVQPAADAYPYTGDFAILENSGVAVYPFNSTYSLPNATVPSPNIIICPLHADGSIDNNPADSIIYPFTPVTALTSTVNYLFTSDGSNLHSYNVSLGGVTPITTIASNSFNKLATDPNGHFLVGVNSTIPSNPSQNNLAVYTIGSDGSLTLQVQAVTHLGAAPTNVRTDGGLIFVLAAKSTSFETFYLDLNASGGYGLYSLGTQYTGNVPVDVDFDPTYQFLYVANQADNSVSAFAINNSTLNNDIANITSGLNGAVYPPYGAVSGSPFKLTTTDTLTSLRVFR